MPQATGSGCINHPGVEAAARCKQCGKPVCNACVIPAPSGSFCSELCRDKHAEFVERAQKYEASRKTSHGLGFRLKKLAIKLVVVIILLVGIAVVLTYLDIYVPIVSELIYWVRSMINV